MKKIFLLVCFSMMMIAAKSSISYAEACDDLGVYYISNTGAPFYNYTLTSNPNLTCSNYAGSLGYTNFRTHTNELQWIQTGHLTYDGGGGGYWLGTVECYGCFE